MEVEGKLPNHTGSAELLVTCGCPNGQVRELGERGGSFAACVFHGVGGDSSGGGLEDSS